MTQDQSTPGAAAAGSADDPAADAPVGARPTPRAPAGTGSASGTDELEGLDDLPLAEHVERFTAVHDGLRARLDGAPGTTGLDGVQDTGPRR
ncbi:hypothetical protein [Isoptericola nanjingensis]|uniref:hypothetical protein n=1 Tax=Isoptericola TaxID=254250 RepID=UPI0035EB5E21|nr:hypothetical protein [Isoptericola sp. QY 916]